LDKRQDRAFQKTKSRQSASRQQVRPGLQNSDF
jgi:hypothetical protein